MWPFNKNIEIQISDSFGSIFCEELFSFLKIQFQATFKCKNVAEPEMVTFDFDIGGKTLTVLSEGMAGTSLIGNKKLVIAVIQKAKKVNPDLVCNCSAL